MSSIDRNIALNIAKNVVSVIIIVQSRLHHVRTWMSRNACQPEAGPLFGLMFNFKVHPLRKK